MSGGERSGLQAFGEGAGGGGYGGGLRLVVAAVDEEEG